MDQNDSYLRPDPFGDDGDTDSLPEDLLSEIDEALESLTSLETNPLEVVELELTPEEAGIGMRQMQETFVELARNALSPIDRYMKAISLGEHYRELLEISELITTPLISKTEAVGLHEHAQDLTFFRSLLLLALGERDPSSAQAMKEVVMEGFNKLSERFGLGFRGYRLAVRNLVGFYRALRSSESISEADIRRFFGVGVPSLTWVRRTKVSELANLSGIAPSAVKEIRRLAYGYRAVDITGSARLAKEDPLIPGDLGVSIEPPVAESNVTEADVYGATEELDVVPNPRDR